jgi:hypothetical protein
MISQEWGCTFNLSQDALIHNNFHKTKLKKTKAIRFPPGKFYKDKYRLISEKTCVKHYYIFSELNLSAYCRTAHTKEEWLQVSGETERGELFTGCTCSASTPEGSAFFVHHSR